MFTVSEMTTFAERTISLHKMLTQTYLTVIEGEQMSIFVVNTGKEKQRKRTKLDIIYPNNVFIYALTRIDLVLVQDVYYLREYTYFRRYHHC